MDRLQPRILWTSRRVRSSVSRVGEDALMQHSEAQSAQETQLGAAQMRAKATLPRPGRRRTLRAAVSQLLSVGVSRPKEIALRLIEQRDRLLFVGALPVSEDQVRRRVIELVWNSIVRTLDASDAQARHACWQDLHHLEERAKDPRGDDHRTRIRSRANTWYLRLDGSLIPRTDPVILEEQRELLRKHANVLGRSRAARQERRIDLVQRARRELRTERKKRRCAGEALQRELAERGGVDAHVPKRVRQFLSRGRRTDTEDPS